MTAANAKHTNAEPSEPDENSRSRSGAVAPAAAWAFAFLTLRVFAVSGYNWDTAFAVSTTLSVGEGLSLVFGSLMAEHLLVALLLMIVLPLLVSTFLWAERGHRTVVLLPAAIGLVLLVAAFGQTPWVPQEQIKTNEGTITAYVLSVDSGYLNILTDDHDFVILNRSDIISRK